MPTVLSTLHGRVLSGPALGGYEAYVASEKSKVIQIAKPLQQLGGSCWLRDNRGNRRNLRPCGASRRE